MSNSLTRKELLEQYEDSLLRLVMHDVAEQEGKLFLDESKALTYSLESRPSPATLDTFTRRLDVELKKQRSRARRPSLFRGLNTIAVAMLAVIVVFFAAMTTVQAFRAKVMNLWLDIRPEYTAFKLKGSNDAADDSSIVVNWTKAYVPTYIPEGYVVNTLSYSKTHKRITFENSQDGTWFTTYLELGESDSPVVDTEGASRFEAILINGRSGTLILKHGLVTVVWEMDNLLFVVQAQTSVETAVRIAEGVKYIK